MTEEIYDMARSLREKADCWETLLDALDGSEDCVRTTEAAAQIREIIESKLDACRSSASELMDVRTFDQAYKLHEMQMFWSGLLDVLYSYETDELTDTNALKKDDTYVHITDCVHRKLKEINDEFDKL